MTPRPTVHVVRVPTQVRDGWSNALVLPEPPAGVVDPGPDTPSARQALEEGCRDAGLSMSAVEVIVVTHTHVDHFGLAGWLQERSGARVACHPLAAEVLQDVPGALALRLDLMQRAAQASGLSPDLIAAASEQWRLRLAWAGGVAAGSALPLREGESLRAGGATWSALHLPGHARDHLCLMDRASGSLVGGDVLLRHRRTVPWLEGRRDDGSRPATLADLVRSWQRVSRQRAEIVWPGHGRPVRAHRILVARRIAETRQGLRATRRAVAAGAATVADLIDALGINVKADGLFAALSEVVARTDWLVDRGLLERRSVGGVLRFSPTT